MAGAPECGADAGRVLQQCRKAKIQIVRLYGHLPGETVNGQSLRTETRVDNRTLPQNSRWSELPI
jgi:hypothetical protein